jgi:hypothetical protein
MASSEMLRRVALVRTDVSEKLSASFIMVTRIGELGTLAVTSNRCTMRRNRPVSPSRGGTVSWCMERCLRLGSNRGYSHTKDEIRKRERPEVDLERCSLAATPTQGCPSLRRRVATYRPVQQVHVTPLHRPVWPPCAPPLLRNNQQVVNNGVFWDIMPCGSCKNRCFGGI